ncbi:MAG TPA: TIGR00645 family protein [Stellaceae bacterium]|nr:TIGR00645 family protein [Stellaceae bacterium]
MERLIERILFASRWLLAPLFLGLAALLVLLVLQFGIEWARLAVHFPGMQEQDVIGGTLTLIDLVLVASLVVMVMLSGYENFVSKIDAAMAGERLAWLMKLDTGSIKVKVLSSIVAISAIDLLKAFFDVETIADDKLMWLVLIHLTFVATAILLTLLDRIAASGKQ